MAKFSFTILGSAAGLARPDRINSGYVLDLDSRLIQFDCGGGIPSAFRRAGFDPLAVERIVISHGHADHVCDLPQFVQMQYLLGREEPLVIHLPDELMDPIQNLFRAVYLFPEKLDWLRFLPISETKPIESDGLIIRPIPNSHLKNEINAKYITEHGLANRMECYSYLIETGGKKILYSADLGSEKDLFDHMFGVDLLIVESMHIDIGNLLGATAENNVGRVVLTHFDEDFDAYEALTQAEKLGVKNMIIANDGLLLDL